MCSYEIVNCTNNRNLCLQAKLATNCWERLRGLLWSQPLVPGHGLIIPHCHSVHTVGMTYPIDVLFIDRNLLVLHVIHSMQPCRLSRIVPKADRVIELPAGTLKRTGTYPSHQLILRAIQPG